MIQSSITYSIFKSFQLLVSHSYLSSPLSSAGSTEGFSSKATRQHPASRSMSKTISASLVLWNDERTHQRDVDLWMENISWYVCIYIIAVDKNDINESWQNLLASMNSIINSGVLHLRSTIHPLCTVHINICLRTPQLLTLSVKSSTRRVTARHSSIVDSKLWTTTSLHDLTHASASSNCTNNRPRLLLHMNNGTHI